MGREGWNEASGLVVSSESTTISGEPEEWKTQLC